MARQPEVSQPSDVGLDEVASSARAAIAEDERDPLVRILIFTILAILILALLTGVYAIVAGVFGSGAPKTYNQAQIMGARARIDAGSTLPDEWMSYIQALTDDGQYRKAQEWIDIGKKRLPDQDISADMLYMQANLDVARGEPDEALKVADLGIKTIKDRYEVGREEYLATLEPNKAFSSGLNDNYYEFFLLKAEVYVKKQDWKSALDAYNAYLEGEPTSANIFTERGDVKAKLGDTAGAEADYRRTLGFMPDDADALAGLNRIGASK
jgi:tetratricopeptide (TPR) repeat protein